MHTITNINAEKRTGTCNECGLVKLRKRQRGDIITWSCGALEEAQQKAWMKTPKGILSTRRSDWYKRNRHHISEATINAFNDATHCECCGNVRSREHATHFCIDHCHTTGKIRGFICSKCNTAIGLLNDSVETVHKVIKYLEKNLA